MNLAQKCIFELVPETLKVLLLIITASSHIIQLPTSLAIN